MCKRIVSLLSEADELITFSFPFIKKAPPALHASKKYIYRKLER